MENDQTAIPPSPEREALCTRCGICCHEKISLNGKVIITDIPCQFLDIDSNFCTVYEERFKRQPRCSYADVSALANGLPGSCPHVRDIPDYQAPDMLKDRPELEAIVDMLYPERKINKIKKRNKLK